MFRVNSAWHSFLPYICSHYNRFIYLQEKPKKNGMSLDEAIDDSENITDFIMDFDEDE